MRTGQKSQVFFAKAVKQLIKQKEQENNVERDGSII